MAPKMNDAWQLPASKLSKLLNERRMLKADLTKPECVGVHTLNKRTVTKIDQGEPVALSTLEKLAKALKLSSVEELMREAQEKVCLEIDFNGPFFSTRNKQFGDPYWKNALEIKVSDIVNLVRWGADIQWELRLDAVTDQQVELLQRLEAIVEKRVKHDVEVLDHPKFNFDSNSGSLTRQLAELRIQDSYANLLSELQDSGIGIYYCKHVNQGISCTAKHATETLFHYDEKWFEQEIYVKNWRFFTTYFIIVSDLNLDVRLHLNGDVERPTLDDLRSNPSKYFSMTADQKVHFDIPLDADAWFHEIELRGHTAFFRDDKLTIVEDEFPF